MNSPKEIVLFYKFFYASDIIKIIDKVFKMINDIVEDVREENVANYRTTEELLMQKITKLY